MNCCFCNAELIFAGSDMCCDVGDYADDDTALVMYFDCPKCGRNYEVRDPRKEDRESVYREYYEGRTRDESTGIV